MNLGAEGMKGQGEPVYLLKEGNRHLTTDEMQGNGRKINHRRGHKFF